jgi:glyoxylase-like metal-dependent hydrolase (beta-lactamase superfamily II)
MTDLMLDVFVGGDNAFNVTSTIVSGERDAVVIGGQFTRTDAERLAETIKASGKSLKAVYVTHGHPDHYWGLTTLRAAFPQGAVRHRAGGDRCDRGDPGRESGAVEATLR